MAVAAQCQRREIMDCRTENQELDRAIAAAGFEPIADSVRSLVLSAVRNVVD